MNLWLRGLRGFNDVFFLQTWASPLIPKAQEEAARKEAEEKAKAERKENGEEEEEINDMAVFLSSSAVETV